MAKFLTFTTLTISCLIIGFFVGKIYTYRSIFDIPHYPTKYSGLYGVDEPCAEDPNDINIQLALTETYRVKNKICRIIGVEKIDGYFDLQPSTSCTKLEGYDSHNIGNSTHEEIKPFRFEFKPLDSGKISARIDGQADKIFTKCHLLRNKKI